jgi:hypothetical protein
VKAVDPDVPPAEDGGRAERDLDGDEDEQERRRPPQFADRRAAEHLDRRRENRDQDQQRTHGIECPRSDIERTAREIRNET